MRSLIIFAGAGASYGVSRNKYPMALDFRERLPSTIIDSPLYRQLIEHLKRQPDMKNGIDIEHILWELGALTETLKEWTDEKRFAARLLTTDQINKITQQNLIGSSVHVQFASLKRIVDSIQNQINECVYDFYSAPPEKNDLERSWIPLLTKVAKVGFERIDIVTTNYDLVIESALENLPNLQINMGFTQGILPGIDLDAWRFPKSSKGMLTKLHGSVDWKLGMGGSEPNPVIRRGHPEFDGDHKKRLILYPGFKGTPSREPFITFHEYFEQRLKETTHILFIGFAFRDEHINNIISSSLPETSKIAVVNPADALPKVSFLKNSTHMKQGFGIEPLTTILASGGVEPLSLNSIENWFREQKE